MLTVLAFLFIVAFIAAVVAAMGRAPLYIAVLLLTIAGLLQVLPLGVK